ncbi:MAG: hypothetical protein AMS17_17590, partial [Spirochaetes bacterium DG_61]
MRRKPILLIIVVLAAFFVGAGMLFAQQEGTSASGDISPNTIIATSGTTTLTYRITNTSGAANRVFDEFRIYNPAGYPTMAVTGQINVNGVNYNTLESPAKPVSANWAYWFYVTGPPAYLFIQLPADDLGQGEYIDISFTQTGLTTATTGVDYTATADQASEGTPNSVVATDSDYTLIINPDVIHHFTINAIGSPQTAGTSFSITVTAYDQFNNVVSFGPNNFNGAGDTVDFYDFTGTISPATSNTFTDGVLNQNVTITKSRTSNRITVYDSVGGQGTGNETGTSNTFDVDPASLDHFIVKSGTGGNIGNQVAGTPFTIDVTAQDQYDNTVTSFTGAGSTVDISLSNGGGITTPSGAFTNGFLDDFSVTATTSGTAVTVRVVDNGGVPGSGNYGVDPSGESNTFNITPGAATQFVIVTTIASPQTAGVGFSVRFEARDGNGNVDTGYNGAGIVVDDGDGTQNTTISPGTVDFTNGVWEGTITVTEASQITLRIGQGSGLTPGTQGPIDIDPNVLDHFIVEAGTGGNIVNQTAGQAFAIDITAEDVYGNRLDSGTNLYSGTVDLSLSNGGSITTPSGNFANGFLDDFNVTIPGADTGVRIQVVDSGGTYGVDESGQSNLFDIQPGAADHFTVVTTIGSPQQAGVPFNVRVEARDAYENVLSSGANIYNQNDATLSDVGPDGLVVSAPVTL